MFSRVPYRLGPQLEVVDLAAGVPWGDGVDDLPVGESVSVPMEMGLQIIWGFGHAGADDERQPGPIEIFEVARREHAGVGGDDHRRVLDAVASAERLDDRQDRVGFDSGTVETADLQRESGSIHQKSDDDLRIHAAFLGESDLAQFVFLLSLEIQCGDVVQDQAQPAGVSGVGEALGRDQIAIPTRADLGEVALKCPVRHHLRPEISQHPQRVGLAGWLGDPGDHQVPEHRIVDHVEAEPVIHRAQHVIQQPRTRPHRAAWPGHPRRCLAGPHEFTCTPVGDIADTLHRCRHLEVEHLLTGSSDPACPFQKNSQLGIGMRRTHMLDQHITATSFAHYLHRHRARGGAHFPHEHAPQPTQLVSQTPAKATRTRRSQHSRPANPPTVS